jgi:hypothetical protein
MHKEMFSAPFMDKRSAGLIPTIQFPPQFPPDNSCL